MLAVVGRDRSASKVISFRMAVGTTSQEAQDGTVAAGFWALTLGSIGVVFGDIGTSPLYALRVAVDSAAQGQAAKRTQQTPALSPLVERIDTQEEPVPA